MTLEELKAKVEAHREGLKGKSGNVATFSVNGPVGMSLIDAVIATMETMQARIAELERQVRD